MCNNKVMIGKELDEINKELFDTSFSKYQKGLKEQLKTRVLCLNIFIKKLLLS